MLITSQRIEYLLVLAVLKILLLPQSTLAQNTIIRSQKTFNQSEKVYLPQQAATVKVDLSNYVVGQDNQDNLNLEQLPERIKVEQIKIVGNSVFTTAELKSLLNLESREIISKNDLIKIIKQLNQVYRDRGYLTSGVFSEPKLQPNRNIIIAVREGTIEEIKITGLKRLSANYIRNRIVRNPQQILNLEQLEQELQLLQVNHLIDNISATVVSGSSFGNSILEVEIVEDDPFYVELSLDNLGSLSSGSFRRQLKVNHDNLLGFGDRFYAAYTNSDGSNALNNLSYLIPLNSRDGTIGVSYGLGKFEIIRDPFDELDIDFEFNRFQIALYQPVYQTPKHEFALALALSRIATEVTLEDIPFPALRRGASNDGELNISAIRFYQDYIKRGTKDRFDFRSEISFGVDIIDATDNDEPPDTNFFIWRGQTSYQRQLTEDTGLHFSSFWQLSDRPLVDLEQTPRKLFTVGGEEETFILRGYRQDSLRADNGIFATAEFQANVLEIDRLNSIFQLTPFVDFGTVWNDKDNNLELDQSTLISVGLGLRLLVNNNFRARVDWGIPLIEQDFDTGSLQEDGITFNIEYRPL